MEDRGDIEETTPPEHQHDQPPVVEQENQTVHPKEPPTALDGEGNVPAESEDASPTPASDLKPPPPDTEQQKPEKPAKRASAVASAREVVAKTELDAGDSSALQAVFRENEAMKEKVSKLKGLLGRSAKAQRETKVELDATHKKLDAAMKENERLNAKIEKLATRPTHMDLLNDFETNFDRAMIAINHQSGGQDTDGAATDIPKSPRNTIVSEGAVVDSLLMQELSESKQRIEKLEKLNSALVHRSSQLESDLLESKKSMDSMLNKLSNLELEKRMAVMEAEQATKAMQEKIASLEEMQLEIDLVTKSAQKAAVKAAAGEEMMKTVKSDKQLVAQLEERVKVLQEWAIASNEAKNLAQERVRLLENQVRRYQGGSQKNLAEKEDERIVFSDKGSLVIGAGDTGVRCFTLDNEFSFNPMSERIVLRWTFDLTSSDADIIFSIYKGRCETNSSRVDALVKDRYVRGGAGGDTDSAFDVQRSCTLTWSNNKSWIKPRTVKYTVDAVILRD